MVQCSIKNPANYTFLVFLYTFQALIPMNFLILHQVEVYSRQKIGFALHCGLILKEMI